MDIEPTLFISIKSCCSLLVNFDFKSFISAYKVVIILRWFSLSTFKGVTPPICVMLPLQSFRNLSLKKPSLGLLFWCLKTHNAFSVLHIGAFEWHSVSWRSYTVDVNVYFHWTNIYIRIHTTRFLIVDRLSLATFKDLNS